MFNQRLLAAHCLQESEARDLWKRLTEGGGGGESNPEKLEDALVLMNRQLKYAGLEIRGVSIVPSKPRQDENDADAGGNDDNEGEDGRGKQSQRSTGSGSSGKGSRGRGIRPVRYYAMINKFPDEVAKACFQIGTVHEQAFVRNLIERFAASGGEPEPWSALVNSRSEINDGNSNNSTNDDGGGGDGGSNKNKNSKTKVTLPQAENLVWLLLDEKWLQRENPAEGGGGKKSSLIGLGPRTYLELSYFLEQKGMEADDLPQMIYHTD